MSYITPCAEDEKKSNESSLSELLLRFFPPDVSAFYVEETLQNFALVQEKNAQIIRQKNTYFIE